MSPHAAAAGVDLDAEQTAAIDAPRAGGTVAITGTAGTGKTFTLVRRALRLAAEANPDAILVSAPSDAGVARLRALLRARDAGPAIVCASLGDIALDVLRAIRGPGAQIEAIDDVRASRHFEQAGAQLFSLEWTELVSAEIDPEITGMRTPERFSAAAYRLIRKLRASLISPEDFKALGLRGAAAFYGQPPNLASADLLLETPAKYRDSLRAGPEELERQRLREVDLVKILTRLYTSYVDTLVHNGCLTPTDAVYEAALALRKRPDVRASEARRFAAILIDDAQDLTLGQFALVEGLAQAGLANVTLAGDDAQSTRGFATGARGSENFKRAARPVVLTASHGAAPALALLAGRAAPEAFALYRADTMRDEARYVASEVARLIASGTPPPEIAVITRNLRCAHVYIDALLARDVPLGAQGAASLYDFPAVRDALGALWSAVDPFRHDYLLRTLQAPWMRLADASLAVLCADATDPQPVLFVVEGDDAEATGGRRWDRRRSLRLGRNVTRGDVDADLPDDARERLAAFRQARERHERAARILEPADLARLIFDETILATVTGDARGRFTRGLVARLQTEIDAYFAREPLASLEDFLTEAELVAASEDDLLVLPPAPGETDVVRVLDVEAAKGENFAAAFVIDVRAGAWPRYYVPEAFLFLPSAGMVPKENVGDARAARTAKFTYASFRFKVREKYNAEERRALLCALTRARDYLSISASGRATRGASTPEILEELRRLCP
jgi:superfamily I DNA/RNA helicase